MPTHVFQTDIHLSCLLQFVMSWGKKHPKLKNTSKFLTENVLETRQLSKQSSVFMNNAARVMLSKLNQILLFSELYSAEMFNLQIYHADS